MLLEQRVCPSCLHEVLPRHLEGIVEDGVPEPEFHSADAGLLSAEDSVKMVRDKGAIHAGMLSIEEIESMTLEELLAASFRCGRCGSRDCSVKEAAMNGTGLSRLFDLDYIHLMYASCEECGKVEWYDSEVLRRKSPAEMSSLLAKLFPARTKEGRE
ncbi:zinc ribbon domain-containing protein [Paenibacillus sp. D51F]